MEPNGSRHILYGSRKDWFTIHNFSDLHLFNAGCARGVLERDLEAVRQDPYAFWVGGGDYVDAISPTDRRWDADAVADLRVKDLAQLGRVQMRAVADLFRPIKHKCLGLLLGNHEKVYQQQKEQADLHGWLCMELGVPCMEYSALFDVIFVRTPRLKTPRLQWQAPANHRNTKSRKLRFMVHHGSGYAQTPGGKLNKLIQFMHMFEADAYMIGHVHDQKAQRLVKVGGNADCTKLVQKETIGVISGSYLKTYAEGVTTYGEQKGYAPVPLGASFIRIHPDSGQCKAEV